MNMSMWNSMYRGEVELLKDRISQLTKEISVLHELRNIKSAKTVKDAATQSTIGDNPGLPRTVNGTRDANVSCTTQ